MRKTTPWGAAQDTRTIAEGIVNYSTAGHGGIWLDAKRWSAVSQLFPDWHSYTGAQWLEEDQDWAIAALAFPHCFSAQDLRAAVQTAEMSARPFQGIADRGWASVCAWIQSVAGAPIRQRIGAWVTENSAMWEKGSSGSPPPGYPRGSSWQVFHRIGGGTRELIIREEYGTWKPLYSDADLERIRVELVTASAPA